MSLYDFANGDPVNGFDLDGRSTTKITSVDGSLNLVINPSNKVLRNVISTYAPGTIKSIEIVGHGGPPGITVGPGSDGDGIVSDKSIQGGKAVYSDDLSSFPDSIRDKMAPGGTVLLNGCNTASYPFVYDHENITQQVSSELPGVVVTGNHGFALTNEVSLPWDRNKSFLIGDQNYGKGYHFDYINGKWVEEPVIYFGKCPKKSKK